MKMNSWLLRIPQRYWAYLALSVWAALSFLLLHKSVYGIDEGAAHALLLVWSIVDDVVSPIVTLGLPDFRTVFLVPVGFLWTGNVLAAKLTSIVVMSSAAWMFYAWRQRSDEAEGALLATGLLLISPIALDQIDTVSVAPYLLIIFALGAWSDRMYRESPQAFGGMYFVQLFLCLASVTLHPAGLAYPLVLLWAWYKTPVDVKQRNYFFGGITFTVLLGLILTQGWGHVAWFMNPIMGLSNLLLGVAAKGEIGLDRWIAGLGMLAIQIWVIWKQAANLWSDLLGRMLLVALAVGVLTGDDVFAMVALTTSLYWGWSLLLHRQITEESGFWEQRGVVLLLVFVIATTFMLIDKMHYQEALIGDLSPRDNLIKTLAEANSSIINAEPDPQHPAKHTVRVASQWPGITMLACRCDALPLPPSANDGGALLAMLKGVDYLIFDPRDPKNSSLSHNLATMGAGKVETVALQQGGVIVEIKSSEPARIRE